GIGRKFRELYELAAKEAGKFKDEYVSTEHFLLAMLAADVGGASRVLRDAHVDYEAVLRALTDVRGTQRVTDPDPEGKYQALERYTRDLTDLAAKANLDPLIRPDHEIRPSLPT